MSGFEQQVKVRIVGKVVKATKKEEEASDVVGSVSDSR